MGETIYAVGPEHALMPSHVVGGKASNIMKMMQMGHPVPKGFVLSTELTEAVNHNPDLFDKPFYKSLTNSWVRWLADQTNKTWDTGSDPLLVSVRSGAPVSMPGMMDTILNVGLNSHNIETFANKFGWAFAFDSFRRLIQMYGTTVHDLDKAIFNEYYEAAKVFYFDLDQRVMEHLYKLYAKAYKREVGEDFPDDPSVQLRGSIAAVYCSWFSTKAVAYRELEGISHDMGTAALVQQMVFGNAGPNSGTGVAFSHDPNTGERGFYGDFLRNAQGEDVVAGTHITQSIKELVSDPTFKYPIRLLGTKLNDLARHEQDMVDVEFTIQDGELFILQYRIAKRSKRASVRMLVDSAANGEIQTQDVVSKILDMIPSDNVVTEFSGTMCLGRGLGITEGVAVGKIAVTHAQADGFAQAGEPYIFCATETAPEDATPMKFSSGILTARGGRLSHAALIARSWGKPCVVGCEGLEIAEDHIKLGDEVVPVGNLIKIDAESGEVFT